MYCKMPRIFKSLTAVRGEIFNQLRCFSLGSKALNHNDSISRIKSGEDGGCMLNWGIAPVSEIGADFAKALKTLPKDKHKLVACAACYRQHANEFAKQFKVPKVFTSFYHFAKCKDIDVVYLSPLNPFHLELGLVMLESGKNVLIEKPLCMNQADAKKLISKAHSKNCFIMEALLARCTPAYAYLRQIIDSGKLGPITMVEIKHGEKNLNWARIAKRFLGGGVTVDSAGYALQLVQWVYRMPPRCVQASGDLNEDGVDLHAEIDLDYGCDRKAHIVLSATEDVGDSAIIKGEKGELSIDNYVCPTVIEGPACVKEFELPGGKKAKTNYKNRIAMAYEAEEVRKCLEEGKTQSTLMSHNESLLLANLSDQIRKQIGVIYPGEEEDEEKKDCK